MGEILLLDKISKLVAPSIAINFSITRCENEFNSYKNVQDSVKDPQK
jgi:hypothetical protein